MRSPYGVMHGKSSLVYYNEAGEEGILAGLSKYVVFPVPCCVHPCDLFEVVD